MAALPGWHPCARMHGHNFEIAVQLTFEDDEVREIDDTVLAVSIATAQLEQLLSHAHLNELMAQDGYRRNASEQWLAGFAHGYIAERLPGAGPTSSPFSSGMEIYSSPAAIPRPSPVCRSSSPLSRAPSADSPKRTLRTSGRRPEAVRVRSAHAAYQARLARPRLLRRLPAQSRWAGAGRSKGQNDIGCVAGSRGIYLERTGQVRQVGCGAALVGFGVELRADTEAGPSNPPSRDEQRQPPERPVIRSQIRCLVVIRYAGSSTRQRYAPWACASR